MDRYVSSNGKRAMWAMLALLSSAFGREAKAFDIDTKTDLKLRWDNTFKLSTALRVQGRNASLIANNNTDDGDRNFAPGFISNRVDLLSEFDISYKFVG